MSIEGVIEFLRGHKRAYQQTFNKHSPAAQYVLGDLMHFCHANKSTHVQGGDRDDLLRNEGRRQVWLRMQQALNLTPEEMFAITRQAKEAVK